MIRNFKQTIKDYKGQPLKDGQGNEQMMSDLLGAQLFAAGGKTALSQEDKMRAYKLCVQMQQHPETVELTTEDATLVKTIVSEGFVAGVYGQVVSIIEQ